jgi:hypothetical protein
MPAECIQWQNRAAEKRPDNISDGGRCKLELTEALVKSAASTAGMGSAFSESLLTFARRAIRSLGSRDRAYSRIEIAGGINGY